MSSELRASIARTVASHKLLEPAEGSSADAATRIGDSVRETISAGPAAIYVRSIVHPEGAAPALIAAVRLESADAAGPSWVNGSGSRRRRRVLLAAATKPAATLPGAVEEAEGLYLQLLEPTPEVMASVMAMLPWTKPQSVRRRLTTFGMGDRIGLATAGQVQAAERYQVAPVLAQQSIRELEFIGRTFPDVVADAAFGVLQAGYRGGYGADGDHLKTLADIDLALDAEMPMITLDLTNVLLPEAAEWSEAEVQSKFGTLPSELQRLVEREYAGTRFEVLGISGEPTAVRLSEAEAKRCALMYGQALAFSEEVDAHLDRRTGGAFDLEISVDETTFPTLPSHHLFIARELERRGVRVSSLAPRFIGEFQKAVDYDGDLAEFERQFAVHAAIAATFGGYKVSVHSGSDKFSVYPIVGRHTRGRLHVKTSGTSWLESLRTLAQTQPELYRRLHRRGLEYFPEARTAYHITPDLSRVPKLDSMSDERLAEYLDAPDSRQLLHVVYGGILTHGELAPAYFDALMDQEATHVNNIASHMGRHLDLLGVQSRA